MLRSSYSFAPRGLLRRDIIINLTVMQISSHTRCTIYCSVHTHIRVGAGSPPLIVYLIVIYLFTCNSATTIKMLNPNTLGRLGSPWGRNSRTSDVLSSYIGKIRIKRRPQSQFNLSYGM